MSSILYESKVYKDSFDKSFPFKIVVEETREDGIPRLLVTKVEYREVTDYISLEKRIVFLQEEI